MKSGRTALALGLAAILTFALTGGGRIVGSDEVTMFELARAMAARPRLLTERFNVAPLMPAAM